MDLSLQSSHSTNSNTITNIEPIFEHISVDIYVDTILHTLPITTTKTTFHHSWEKEFTKYPLFHHWLVAVVKHIISQNTSP